VRTPPPVVVDGDGNLLAGLRRLKACEELGWKRVPVHVVRLDDRVRAERVGNSARKDFLPSQAVAIAEASEEAARPTRAGTFRKFT